MMRKKKRILAPGEMEEITLGRKELEQIKGKKELMMFTHRTRKMWKIYENAFKVWRQVYKDLANKAFDMIAEFQETYRD